jgi:hypothetical protein
MASMALYLASRWSFGSHRETRSRVWKEVSQFHVHTILIDSRPLALWHANNTATATAQVRYFNPPMSGRTVLIRCVFDTRVIAEAQNPRKQNEAAKQCRDTGTIMVQYALATY